MSKPGYEEKRKICAQICVRYDTKSTRCELSRAENHGGPDGSFRVRVNRRWLDTAEGERRYFDAEALGALVASLLSDRGVEPQPVPVIPCPSRVSVVVWKNGLPQYIGTWTNTEPIQDVTGQWVVNVSLKGKRVFVPVADVRVHDKSKAALQTQGE